MKTQKGVVPVFSLILTILFLSQCDACVNDLLTTNFWENAAATALRETFVAQQTKTAAPLHTWTAQANQTLTALPANETATSAAMGATETRAMRQTEELFTREAVTVAAIGTQTRIAFERGTNTPTRTPTFTRTNTPSQTPTFTQTPTPTITLTLTPSPTQPSISRVYTSTILNTIVNQLPINQIFSGQSPRRAADNVTDPSAIYSAARVDFLKQNNGITLINNWQTSDTSFTFVGNHFPTSNVLTQWQDLSLQSPPATAANDQLFAAAPDSIAPFQSVVCKTGVRTNSGRQFTTGYCDIFTNNVHFGFNFLTTKDVQALMNTKAPLIFKTLADTLE